MRKRTRKAGTPSRTDFERALNVIYKNSVPEGLKYLVKYQKTGKRRGARAKPIQLGSLMRRKDPDRFAKEYRKWLGEPGRP